MTRIEAIREIINEFDLGAEKCCGDREREVHDATLREIWVALEITEQEIAEAKEIIPPCT